MPSGAKKRKAAKKKKELQANNANTLEHDDAKSQDDKGSDGSEVSSPAQQDHHNNHSPFNEGDPSGVRPIASEDSNSMEKVPSGAEEAQKVIEIEWSLKPEKDDEDGSSSSSSSRSSTSSDDESRADKKKQDKEATRVAETESSGDGNVVAELSPVIESVKPVVVPVSEETINVVELESALVDNLLVSEVIKSDAGVVPESEDSKASPSKLKSDPKGHEGKELPPSEAHIAQPSTVDPARASKTLTGPENTTQAVVHQVEKTPWWSCCGIFDVVSGSR